MPTVVLFPRYDEDTQMIWDAAVKRGWKTIRGSAVTSDDQDTCIYGGVMWADRVAKSLGLSLLWPVDDWLLTLPLEQVKRQVTRMNGVGVKSIKFPQFVKSLHWKDISSRTYFSKDDLPPNLDDDKEYLVSEVVTFEKEFRAFILDGKVHTIGPYAKSGLLDYEVSGVEEANDFLSKSVSMQGLPRAAVVDVGYIKGRGWAVIESNAAWCSGIYTCDPDKVLDVVHACAIRDPQL